MMLMPSTNLRLLSTTWYHKRGLRFAEQVIATCERVESPSLHTDSSMCLLTSPWAQLHAHCVASGGSLGEQSGWASWCVVQTNSIRTSLVGELELALRGPASSRHTTLLGAPSGQQILGMVLMGVADRPSADCGSSHCHEM